MLNFVWRHKRSFAIGLVVLGLWSCWWAAEPSIFLTLAQVQHSEREIDELGADPVVDHLVGLGGRAVSPILQAIKKDTPWSKNTVFLSGVLRRIGRPAQQGLLDAIVAETDPKVRVWYIYCLQEAFGDYSQMPIWLNTLKEMPYTSNYLRKQVFFAGNHSVPEILTSIDRSKNPEFTLEFLTWYKQRSGPKGPYPAWTQK